MAVYKSEDTTNDGRKYYFQIRYKDIFGNTKQYKSKKYLTKKEATIEEAKFKIDNSNKELTSSNITLEQAYVDYMKKKSKEIKKQSIAKNNYLYCHLEILKKYKVNDLNVNHYNKLTTYLDSQNLGTEYKNKILTLFRAIIKYSNKYYNTSDSILKFADNYKKVNEMKKEMEFFTYEEYQIFRNAIGEFEWCVWFDTLYYLGLRQGESQALTFKDIDLDNKTISISKTLTSKIKGEEWTISTPKTKSSIRILPLPDLLVNEYKQLKTNAKKYKDYKDEWFLFGNSIPFKENKIQIRKNKYCDKANIKRIRIHDFRHSCASFLINYCHATISLVSKYLGHSDISMTLNRYTHMYRNELEDITKLINNL